MGTEAEGTEGQCICGRGMRVRCPLCDRWVRLEHGKRAAHEVSFCTGSHLEYRTCKGSGKPHTR